MQLSYDQIKALQKQTADELHVSDPEKILQVLNIDFQSIGNDSYKLKVRSENHASAYITIRQGVWKFKDFGTNKNGTIENVVMEVTGRDYKSALQFCLDTLLIRNRLEEAIHHNKMDHSLSQEERERIQAMKEQNSQREKSVPVSRVLNIKEISSYTPAVEYLASRGIHKIPPPFKLINGEYYTKEGIVKRAFGVGILTQGNGGDIHFLRRIGDLKSMSFGNKDISLFLNENSKKVAVFESKMDYAAAYQQIDLSQVNVIIANTTSNPHKIAEFLKDKEYEQITFFNQNDQSGIEFLNTIIHEANIQQYCSLQYHEDERGKDVNDLVIGNQKIISRLVINQLEAIQEQSFQQLEFS
ncbi:toprim domain-containing protein [Sulfurospirillum cavolei]|uniref:toprim domain-containing protein n=1 Tax=Sulfurospirillum cavolei TaxID=366522 RepID=UPI0005A7FDC7|nr:toprim domain-containing protein [Sulfurospirillum cavolei]